MRRLAALLHTKMGAMYITRLINYHTLTSSSPPPCHRQAHSCNSSVLSSVCPCLCTWHVIFAKPPSTHKQEPTEHVRSVIKSPIWQARCCLYPLPSHPHNHRRNMSPLPGSRYMYTGNKNGKSCANICVAFFINIERGADRCSLSISHQIQSLVLASWHPKSLARVKPR